MKKQSHSKVILIIASLSLSGALEIQSASAASPPPAKSPWGFSAGLTLKESFDSNVYLQDTDPWPANVAAAQAAGLRPVEAHKKSLVTSILPKLDLSYKPCAAFGASAGYAPEVVFYHSAHTEDHVAHRGSLKLGGAIDKALWELNNTAIYIDGSDLGLTFALPGDVPAIGGIPLRDRREAFIFRNNFKLTYPIDKWFIRPVASVYVHNFSTEQRPSGAGFIYENYIDRQDVNGGLDVGYQIAEKTSLVLGYRYGAQEQYRLLGVDSPYDNGYHRILAGVEGSPWDWIKLAIMAGPDLRDFGGGTPAAFDRNEMLYYIDASVTLLPTAKDTITLMNRRYEHPAFASVSVYEDITYDISWRHKFDNHWAAGAGFRVYAGDWQAPASREDWIYTPSVSVSYTWKKFSAELAYSYDWVDSAVPNTDAREFTRHLVALAAKYTF